MEYKQKKTESLDCIPVTYIISYSNYTSIKIVLKELIILFTHKG